MSGVAISSTTPRLTFLPQNSVNQRPTTALLLSSLLILNCPRDQSRNDHRKSIDDLIRRLRFRGSRRTPILAFELKIRRTPPRCLTRAGLWPGRAVGSFAGSVLMNALPCPNEDTFRYSATAP